MKGNLFIAGNWKSNKTISESRQWLESFGPKIQDIDFEKTKITLVIVAPFMSIDALKQGIIQKKIPILLAAQNVSKFEEGAFTGEVSSRMIKEVAEWVLIGHS